MTIAESIVVFLRQPSLWAETTQAPWVDWVPWPTSESWAVDLVDIDWQLPRTTICICVYINNVYIYTYFIYIYKYALYAHKKLYDTIPWLYIRLLASVPIFSGFSQYMAPLKGQWQQSRRQWPGTDRQIMLRYFR
jgi:hypothetical protein